MLTMSVTKVIWKVIAVKTTPRTTIEMDKMTVNNYDLMLARESVNGRQHG